MSENTKKKVRIAVLVSGGGTNLQALLDAEKSGVLKDGEICLVVSNNPNAFALERIKGNGNIKGCVVSAKEDDAFEKELLEILQAEKIELIILAGFLRILRSNFTSKFDCRIINVHPSLIPAFCGKGFYGLRVHREVLAAGTLVTGATVHFVNEVPDGGKIIAQRAVYVRPDDTPEVLQRRVMQEAEWVILPAATQQVCRQILAGGDGAAVGGVDCGGSADYRGTGGAVAGFGLDYSDTSGGSGGADCGGSADYSGTGGAVAGFGLDYSGTSGGSGSAPVGGADCGGGQDLPPAAFRGVNAKALVSADPYVGRGIIIGRSPDGSKACTAYFIMGRSPNSRNRVFSLRQGELFTEPFDASKVEDPSLIIYAALRTFKNNLIVTNGDQTDTIYDGLASGKTFSQALESREFEPDAPNFTPRISGMITFTNSNIGVCGSCRGITDSSLQEEQGMSHEQAADCSLRVGACGSGQGTDFSYQMSILKSADAEGTACNRYTFAYSALPGLGHFIHTYIGDGNPLPTFYGEPEPVIIPDSIDDFADELWSGLDEDNKISLYVRYVDIATGKIEERLINKNMSQQQSPIIK